MYEGIECNADGRIVNITLSGMNLQGTISSKLGRLGHLRHLHLDGNHLTGIVPSDLRLCPLETLRIENNQLLGPIPPLLCQKEGLNGNGNGNSNNNNNNILLSCDVVACPVNTWHQNGRASTSTQHCLACPNLPYVGQTHCPNTNFATEAVLKSISNVKDYAASHGRNGWILLVATTTVMIFICLLLLVRRQRHGMKREQSSSVSTDTMKLTTHTEEVNEEATFHHPQQQQYQRNKGNRSSSTTTTTTTSTFTSLSSPVVRFPPDSSMSQSMHYNTSQQPPPLSLYPQGGATITENIALTSTSTLHHSILMTRPKRDTSPVDDPDTQDLWLDVPKIE
jgi:hypothetical protein